MLEYCNSTQGPTTVSLVTMNSGVILFSCLINPIALLVPGMFRIPTFLISTTAEASLPSGLWCSLSTVETLWMDTVRSSSNCPGLATQTLVLLPSRQRASFLKMMIIKVWLHLGKRNKRIWIISLFHCNNNMYPGSWVSRIGQKFMNIVINILFDLLMSARITWSPLCDWSSSS